MYCMWGAVCCVVSVLKLFLPFLAATLRRPRDEEEVPQRVKSDLYASLRSFFVGKDEQEEFAKKHNDQ